MNCEDVRELIFAFADDALPEEQREPVAAHVQTCAACAARVEAQRRMRAAVGRVVASERAPASLRTAVLLAIEQGDPASSVAVDARRPSTPREAPARRERGPGPDYVFAISGWLRHGRRYALAATIALAALVGVYFVRSPRAGTGGKDSGGGGVAADVVAAQFASDVAALHAHCVPEGTKHHHAGLPRELGALAAAMSRHLGFRVLAPDLRPLGMDFAGADYCRLPKRDGAHLLYLCSRHEQAPISVFSVRRDKELAALKTEQVDGQDYVVLAADKTNILAWKDGDAVYVTCGTCPRARIVAVAERARASVVRGRSPLAPVTLAKR